MLRLPDHSRPFEVHTDASDFAIDGVIMQDGHPIAYESRKLKDAERRYTVHEREMTAIVYCLRTWRHYFLGAEFVVKTDNVAMSYFQTQKKLTPKQARWQMFLAEFDFALEYKVGKTNVVVDALSRRVELTVACVEPSEVHLEGALLSRIREGTQQDPTAQHLVSLAQAGKTRRFWLQDDLLVTKGGLIFVPRWESLRRELLKECHDTLCVGHPGQERTLALLERGYYWPQMRDDVEGYVRTCLICQQDKGTNQKAACLLEPLPIPERPWDSISMDFIVSLPKVEGFSSILVVVDRFFKVCHLHPSFQGVPCREDCRVVRKACGEALGHTKEHCE